MDPRESAFEVPESPSRAIVQQVAAHMGQAFDLDVQQATQMLNELRAANVVIKDPDGPKRGPSIRWLPADRRKRA